MRAHEERILFLREFTKHLIINSKEKEVVIIQQVSLNQVNQLPGIIPGSIKIQTKEINPEIVQKRITRELRAAEIGKTKIIPMQVQPKFQARIISKPVAATTPQSRTPITKEIPPEITPIPIGFDLGKLNMLTRDPRVSIIECSGPNKLILARIYGRATATKISLTDEEIRKIIQQFSNAAKIPILGGLFKVAVGNLLITAVISDLVGSRFVITKLIPPMH